MMRWIVASSLRFRFLVVALAGAMLFVGISQLSNAPLDVFPEFAQPRVEIQTPCLGLTAQEVEALVTVPLEQALNGVDGLVILRSKSVPDLSSIEMRFRPGTDLLKSRQLVQERVATVIPKLPTWAAPPVMMPPLSSTSRTMKIGLSSPTKAVSMLDMSMISYWTIRARLLQVPGVANVAIWGERIKMPQVLVDPPRAMAYNVSLNEIMDVTGGALDSGLLQFSDGALIGTGGFVETDTQRFQVRHISPLTSPDALAQIPIRNRVKPDGTPLILADVADVVEGTWPLFGDAVINGGDGILLIVEKYPWANTLDVTNGVEAAINALRPGLPGIEIDTTIFRPATFIELALENLARSLLIGCLLVMVVLALFLFEWRTALISMIAIPLSLLAGALVLQWRGASINTMVLAGFVIAVGVVVDDAIIDVENVVRRLRQRRLEGSTQSTGTTILEASLEVRSAIVYATLIDVMALMPIFFIGGVSGAFFIPLALSYGLAVLASMLVALTVTPALCFILLANAPIEKRSSPFTTWLQNRYSGVLGTIVRAPRLAYVAVAAVMIAGIAIMPQLKESLLPPFKERDFLMHWVTPPGTSGNEEKRITARAYHDLIAIPGVRNFGSHIGQALLADEVYGIYFGENWISIDPSVDYQTTRDAIQKVVDSYPGLYRDVQTYLRERINEVVSGGGHSLVVRLFGPELPVLRSEAERVQAALQDIEGIEGLHVELQVEIPSVQVQVDLAKAAAVGLKPGDVRRHAATMMAGEEVGDMFRDGKAYDVNVWSTPATRSDFTAIQNLLIDTPSGTRVRLGDIADVRVVPTANEVRRENDSRRIDVSADVAAGRALGDVARDVDARLRTVDMPFGYHAEILGEYAERQAAQNTLFLFAIAAAVGIFFLLAAAFGNVRLAVLAFVTLPTALVGGVLAAWLGGSVISLGSLVGFLTVFGIAARNGIMLINHYQHLEREEGETFGLALVVRGARERLAPILMTASATGLAIVPLVAAGDIPGHEIEHPMAVVILGGLVTSTLLNLFVVPALYLRFGRSTEREVETRPVHAPAPVPVGVTATAAGGPVHSG
jgi:CzcA family heavy metal efflux pump